MIASSALPSVSSQVTQQTFARRSLIPLRKDCLWKIETGFVRTMTWREDGTLITLGLWGPGDIVGKVLSTADPYQIECLSPVEVSILYRDHWQEITEAFILHIQRSEELMQILHNSRQAEYSLLQLFAWLAKRFGQDVEQGQLIDLRLTHQEIAELIGLNRVTVTRLLKELEQQGMIQRRLKRFVLLQDQSPFWHYEI